MALTGSPVPTPGGLASSGRCLEEAGRLPPTATPADPRRRAARRPHRGSSRRRRPGVDGPGGGLGRTRPAGGPAADRRPTASRSACWSTVSPGGPSCSSRPASSLLLFLQQRERRGALGTRGAPGPRRRPALVMLGPPHRRGPSARPSLGASSTALAVALPVLVPTLGLDVWTVPGRGQGGDGISVENPLGRPAARPAARGRRPAPAGGDRGRATRRTSGSRCSNRFNGQEWSSGDRTVPRSQVADGDLPELLGRGPRPGRTETAYSFSATDRPRLALAAHDGADSPDLRRG